MLKTKYFYPVFIFSLLLSQPSLADEAWNSNYGKVVYEKDVGKTALWSFNVQGVPGLIYIDNLAGVYQGRGSYKGYWVQTTSANRCKTARMMHDTLSFYWGQIQIHFLDPGFPTRWEAKRSYCEQQPNDLWQGEPVIN